MSDRSDIRYGPMPLAKMAAFHRASSRHSWDHADTPFRPAPSAEVPLQPAAMPDASLSSCISARLSCRRFDPAAALTMVDLSNLLHLAYGQLGPADTMQQVLETRPVPSASGLYALELLVIAQSVDDLPGAIYRYDTSVGSLRAIAALPAARDMSHIFLDQPWVAQAPAIIVMTGKPQAVAARYHERAYRFLLLECGHVGQNLALGTAALGLASCPVGGFEDYRLCCAAGLAAEQEWPLYALAIGHADPEHAADLRTPSAYEGW